MRQRAAAHVQQLEDLVERRRVGRPGRADRVEPLEVAGDQVGGQQRLAGPHPVAVAHDRVDLAVVRDEPERVRERPARERVGREPRVHDAEGRGDPLVTQVGEELVELIGGEHPLVGQGPRRERREVDVGLLLGPAAQAEGDPLERHAGQPLARAGHEQLRELRHHAERGGAEAARLGGDLAPPEDREPLLGGDLLDLGPGLGHRLVVAGQEGRADGVRAGGRELEPGLHCDGAQEGVGDLHQDAGAVTGVGLGARRTPVLEVAQRGQGLRHDVVAGLPGQGGHEGDAARVVLVPRVVEPLGRRERVLVGHRSISRRRRGIPEGDPPGAA